MRLREPYARKAKGKFGNWLADKLDENDMIQAELADLLHVTPTTVSCWQIHYFKPKYLTVCVMCMLFNDDFDKVWRFVEEDWA